MRIISRSTTTAM